ncbi:hypothetical protein GGI21_005289 [Coemansia aciculifera]|uniref:Uncharacterized protein n=1 Tax=Coemansia aciculifera TaxID=417176 RepID=A0ACC1LY03_9FUNG|nr:hypothetical protein IWW38_004390 [Coemansia aciculifera]KAJ2894446.1 hypothetical protein GGI21_005289 [Coemansia aciculifera]
MARRVTNFDQEFFAKDSGFQSVHARTLPGRTMEYQSWFDSSFQYRRLPLAYNTYTGQPVVASKPSGGSSGRPYYPSIFNDSFFKPPPPAEAKPAAKPAEAKPAEAKPAAKPAEPKPAAAAAKPTEAKPVVAAKPAETKQPDTVVVPIPAVIKDHSDRREITVTSDLFKETKPSVQLRGRELRIHAAKVVTGSSASGAVTSGSDFEYKVLVPEDTFNLAKISAKRDGSVLVIVVPKK